MNKTYFLLTFIISIISGFTSYFATNNLIIAGAICGIFFLYFVIFGWNLYKKYELKRFKYHECYKFINSFVVTLSIRNSIDQAFDSCLLDENNKFKEELDNVDAYGAIDKVKYLKNYFYFDVYRVFLNIIDLYLEEGGNILRMSELLLSELARGENYNLEFDKRAKSKIVEFGILWGLTYVIIMFIRFALKDYFTTILASKFYKYSIIGFFGFVLISIHVMLKNFTNEKIGKQKEIIE